MKRRPVAIYLSLQALIVLAFAGVLTLFYPKASACMFAVAIVNAVLSMLHISILQRLVTPNAELKQG